MSDRKPIKVIAVRDVVEIRIPLTPQQGNDLYGAITNAFRIAGVDNAADRGKHPELQALYELYDELYSEGIS